MSRPGPRPELVVVGDVIVAAGRDGLERAEAIGIAGGRVVAVGRERDVLDAAPGSSRVLDFGEAAIIPGLHDFHIHLVGLARRRAGVSLDDAADIHEVAARLRERSAGLPPDAWLTGRGWTEAQLRGGVGLVRDAVGERATYLSSHDGHSAWASPAALRAGGVTAETADPSGGRIEQGDHGEPTGVLRERALELVDRVVPRLRGTELRAHLEAVIGELHAFGITGATEAGDYTDENGRGPDAALGDSFSALTELSGVLDGRIRITIGIPSDALAAAEERGLRTGAPIGGTLRFGWAKEYADGALGSGTAALFEPATCADGDVGILRVTDDELDRQFTASRRSGIALAVHAIGDRAAATVLDAAGRAPRRRAGVPSDRMEHLQLLRATDRSRLIELGITASIQPIHAAADRDLVEECWRDRAAAAYPWRSLADAGALLAAGSDAPVESVDPWLGIFAAVHRRLPTDRRGDWRAGEALSVTEVLAAYTVGPARALGVPDEGHLRHGARADLAVLDVPVDTLLDGGEPVAAARSVLTVVDGRIVHEA
jgi:predicted amidohydrolase YtcJ